MIEFLTAILILLGVRIEEDTIFWNCHTMGNHICGEQL